jgi:hypothetical protein
VSTDGRFWVSPARLLRDDSIEALGALAAGASIVQSQCGDAHACGAGSGGRRHRTIFWLAVPLLAIDTRLRGPLSRLVC